MRIPCKIVEIKKKAFCANVWTVPRSSEAQSNPRGIPVAPFVDDVEKFVDSRADIEPNLKKFQEMIAFVSFVRLYPDGHADRG